MRARNRLRQSARALTDLRVLYLGLGFVIWHGVPERRSRWNDLLPTRLVGSHWKLVAFACKSKLNASRCMRSPQFPIFTQAGLRRARKADRRRWPAAAARWWARANAEATKTNGSSMCCQTSEDSGLPCSARLDRRRRTIALNQLAAQWNPIIPIAACDVLALNFHVAVMFPLAD
jgi:hypothetical protein